MYLPVFQKMGLYWLYEVLLPQKTSAVTHPLVWVSRDELKKSNLTALRNVHLYEFKISEW
jgi:hypothetical protein